MSSVEYVVILVLVAAVSIGAWSAFGAQVLCAARDATGAFAQIGTAGGPAPDCSTESDVSVPAASPPAPIQPPEERVKRKIH